MRALSPQCKNVKCPIGCFSNVDICDIFDQSGIWGDLSTHHLSYFKFILEKW